MVAISVALTAALAGCGDDGERAAREKSPAGGGATSPQPDASARPDAATIEPVPCPPDLANCASARGEIVYVEAVDPDGDGDAHFVLLSDENITGGGLSVIDVRADLRPRPLPGPGDLVAAAGPVYRGSYGQRQIEAVEVRVVRTP